MTAAAPWFALANAVIFGIFSLIDIIGWIAGLPVPTQPWYAALIMDFQIAILWLMIAGYWSDEDG